MAVVNASVFEFAHAAVEPLSVSVVCSTLLHAAVLTTIFGRNAVEYVVGLSFSTVRSGASLSDVPILKRRRERWRLGPGG